ncbi:hypothetical protein HKD37_08G022735 [Glycine soja]
MSACKTLSCFSLSSSSSFFKPTLLHPRQRLTLTRRCSTSALLEEPEPQSPSVQHLLTSPDGVSTLMKMDRKPLLPHEPHVRWFPYLDAYRCRNGCVLSSAEVVQALAPCISDDRRQRFGSVVRNRSYSVCLVVEGLCDFGNVSATFRSADALGVQSVHVVSCDANKRCC